MTMILFYVFITLYYGTGICFAWSSIYLMGLMQKAGFKPSFEYWVDFIVHTILFIFFWPLYFIWD